MKHLRRCFCVLLCFVLLLGVSSVSAKAVEVNVKSYHGYSVPVIRYNSNNYDYFTASLFYPSNGIEEKYQYTLLFDNNKYNSYGAEYIVHHNFANDDGSILFEGGIKTTVRVENIFHQILISCSDYLEYHKPLDYVNYKVVYIDGSTDFGSASFYVADNVNYSVKFTFTPSKDVKQIGFDFVGAINFDGHSGHQTEIISYIGEFTGDDKHSIVIQQPSEEAGLLQGILGSLGDGFKNLGDKLSGVWTAITDGFTNMGNKLTNVWTAITDGFTNMGNKLTDLWNTLQELPSKLWGLIENGLKGLFVPDEDYITDVKARIEEWAERTWGGMYQAVVLLYDVWDSINDSQFQNTIEIPETTINLTDGNSFTFGGWVVPIVPDGFEFLANIVRWVIAVFATLFFINGLRKRYDRIFGG